MTDQHQEFQTWMRDAERLRLYAQSVIFYHKALSASFAEAKSSSRAKVESELAKVQNDLAIANEDRWKVDDKVSRLADNSLILELETYKDEMSSIKAEAFKENEALREAYEEGFNVIFNYGYGCCAFAHNICGIQPEVPNVLKAPQVMSLPKLRPLMFVLVKLQMRLRGRLLL